MENNTNEYSNIAAKGLSDTSSYIKGVLAGNANYFQRFFTFIIFTQLLYFLVFVISKIFYWFEWYGAIPIFLSTVFLVGIIFLFIFLFKGVNAKSLSFYVSGTIYFVMVFIIAGYLRVESFIDFLANINDITFLGGWALWNLLYSTMILLIGTARTFLLGFVYDYKK